MKAIKSVTQPFIKFLESLKDEAKFNKDHVLSRICNVLIEEFHNQPEVTLKDILESEPRRIHGLRGLGTKTYLVFCELFKGSKIKMSGWPVFKDYSFLLKEVQEKKTKLPTLTATISRKGRSFSIKVKAAGRVRTIPASSVEQAQLLLNTLKSITAVLGLPTLVLPNIPK